MCKTNKLGLTIVSIVALTLEILMLVANNSFASITFYQLSKYDKNKHYTAPKEYPKNPAMETTGAIRVGTKNVPIMKAVLKGEKGGTTLETLTVVYAGTRISDIGKHIEIYEGSTLLSERSFVGSEATLWVSRSTEEGITRTYIIVIEIASDAGSYEVDLRVKAVNGYPTNSFIKDGEKIPDREDYGNIGTVNTPDPEGHGLIDPPPMTAQISKISRISSSGEVVESGKIRSGSSGNEILFECIAVESIGNGGSLSFTVQAGWTQPQGTKGREGYTYVRSDGNIGNPTFSPDGTMQVPTKSLSEGQHIWIYYGYGGGLSGVVVPISTEKYTFTIKAKPSDPPGGEFMELTDDLLKGNLSVNVINAPDGSGKITVSPITAAAGGRVTLTFKYEPIGVVNGGEFSIAIPTTWSEPTNNPDNDGYTTVDCSSDAEVESPIFGEEVISFGEEIISEIQYYTITVPIIKLTAGQYATVIYSGISPPELATVTFPVKSKGSPDGMLRELYEFPVVKLTLAPSGSGTAKVNISEIGVGTIGNEITFTYIPAGLMLEGAAISLTVPNDWISPRGVTTINSGGAISEPKFYGNTIEIPIKNITYPDVIQIHYGAIGDGVTASLNFGIFDFIIKSKGSASEPLIEVKGSPIRISTVCDGSGLVAITEVKDQHGNLLPISDDAFVLPGSDKNSLTITYTATHNIDNNGQLTIEIPPDLVTPQINQEKQPGYIFVESSEGSASIRNPGGSRTIAIDIQWLRKSGTIALHYTNFSVSPEINKEYKFVTKSTCQKDSAPKMIMDSPILYAVPVGYPGCGKAEIDQQHINASSDDNVITIRYTADGDMLAKYNCAIFITIPECFTLPTKDNISSAANGITYNGNTVTIPIDLSYGESIEIGYGPFSTPPKAGSYTFIVESSYNGTTEKIGHSPTLEVGNIAPGKGYAKITQPNLLFTGSADNSVTIEFTAIGTMDGGGIRARIPEQIGTPVSASVSANPQGNAQIGSFSIDGQKIIIPIQKMERDDKILVSYNNFVAPSSKDTLEFQIEASGDGKNYAPIETNPKLDVVQFDGKCTISPESVIARSVDVDIVFEFTPVYPMNHGLVQITIPADFPSPQTSNSDKPGYIEALSDGLISNLIIDRNLIQISIVELEPGKSISVNYENIVIPDTSGTVEFKTFARGSAQGTLSKISDSPSLTINQPLDTIPPSIITNLSASNPTLSSITLTWTAPGDDGDVGRASQYDIRYATSPITEDSWVDATECHGEPTPQVAGSAETFTVTNLASGNTYYFVIKTADEALNWSEISNVAQGTTKTPFVVDAGEDKFICHPENGGETKIGGNPTASGGTPPYIYNWMPKTGLDNPNSATPTATPSSTTTYTITVIDSSEPSQKLSDSVTVTVSPELTADAGEDKDITPGDSIKIGGNPTASGGIAPYTYSWTPSLGLDDATIANPTASPGETIMYTVTVTDKEGCVDSAIVTITVTERDDTPPTPNTIIISAVSTDSIEITSEEAQDDTPPVYYSLDGQYFNSDTWTDDGGGVSDYNYSITRPNPWADTGLMENGLYRYRQRVKDSAKNANESSWSSWVEKATLLDSPKDTEITFSNVTTNGMYVTVVAPQKPSGAGSTGAYFVLITGEGQGDGATDREYADDYTAEYSDLKANTQYGWKVKYRNRDGEFETNYNETEQKRYTLIETPEIDFGTVTTSSIEIKATGVLSNLDAGSSGVYFDSTTSGGDGGINEWIKSTSDTATGLSPNTQYTFHVKACNGDGVETKYSPPASKYTLANTPSAPTVSTTLDVDVNPNGNPADTLFAIYNETGKYYVDVNGGNNGEYPVWRTESDWGKVTVKNLEPHTEYTFKIQAKNGDNVKTDLSEPKSGKTLNSLPQLRPIGNKEVKEGELLSFTVTATDVDGDSLTLKMAFPNGQELPPQVAFTDNYDSTGSFSWTPGYDIVVHPDVTKVFTGVTFKVKDGYGGEDSEEIQITVSDAPLQTISIPKVEGEAGSIIEASIDIDSDFENVGSIDVTLTYDADLLAAKEVVNIVAGFSVLSNLNEAGKVIIGAFSADGLGKTIAAGAMFKVKFEVDANAKRGSMSKLTLEEMILSNDVGEEIAVKVENGEFTVKNNPPKLTPIGNKEIKEGELLFFTVAATDKDKDKLKLTVENLLPKGAIFTDKGNNTGTFSWTPIFTQAGIYKVTFKATDGYGGEDSEVIQITVLDVPQIVIVSVYLPGGKERLPGGCGYKVLVDGREAQLLREGEYSVDIGTVTVGRILQVTVISPKDPEDVKVATKSRTITAEDISSKEIRIEVTVSNTPPWVKSLDVSPSQVYRTQSVKIIARGDDKEDETSKLGVVLEFKLSTGDWMGLKKIVDNFGWTGEIAPTDGSWTLPPGKEAVLGEYSFRARYTDCLGGESTKSSDGEEVVRKVTVKNNLPSISSDIDGLFVEGIERNKPPKTFVLTNFESDVEDIGVDLNWSIDSESVNTSILKAEISNIEDKLTITPIALGKDDITLILTDKDNGKAERDVTIKIIDTIPPEPPLEVVAIDTQNDSGGSITVSWKLSPDDGQGANDVEGYRIYRSTNLGQRGEQIGTAPSGQVEYKDNTTIDGTKYYYVVTVYDKGAGNESSLSNRGGPVFSINNQPPQANFTFSPSEPREGLDVVTFKDTSTPPPKEEINSWKWDFGDGTTSTEKNPKHTYSADGIYKVALQVISSNGLESNITKNVKVNNVPPTAIIVEPPTPPTIIEGSMVSFIGGFTDPGSDDTLPLFKWDFGDGAEGKGREVQHKYPKKGTFTVTLIVTDSDGDKGENTLLVTVIPPLLAVNLEKGRVGDWVNVDGTFVANKNIGEISWGNITITQSEHGLKAIIGSLQENSVVIDANGRFSIQFTVPRSPSGQVRISVGYANSSFTVINTPPSAPTVEILPEQTAFSPVTTDTLQAKITQESIDANGDEITYKYEWFKNGKPTGITVPSVPPDKTAKGEIWQVKVTPNDGLEDGFPGTAKVTVRNTPPTKPEVVLKPEKPFPLDTLTAVITKLSSDADGDLITYTYEWFKNGILIKTEQTQKTELSFPPPFTKGEVWQVKVTPNDGEADGTSSFSQRVIIGDIVVRVTIKLIEGEKAFKNSVLKADVEIIPEQFNIKLAYQWYNQNGAIVGATSQELKGKDFKKHDKIYCGVTASKDSFSLTVLSNELEISNSSPSQPEVTISPSEPFPGDKLEAVITKESSDADGDFITYIYRWFKDGKPIVNDKFVPSSTSMPADAQSNATITATIKNTKDKVFTRTRTVTFEVSDDSIGTLKGKKRITVRTVDGKAEIKLLSTEKEGEVTVTASSPGITLEGNLLKVKTAMPPDTVVETLPYTKLLTVDLTASDKGGSGLKSYVIQYYKEGKDGKWTDCFQETIPERANYWKKQITFGEAIEVKEGHTYYFRSRACDNAGNWGEYSKDTHTTVDTKAPVVSVLLPPDGSTTNNAKPNISAIITDIVSGVNWKDTVMTINGPSLHNAVIRGIENETGRINYTPKEPLSDGKYVVTFKTSDKAGNSPPDEKNWVFNIDTTPPTASIKVSSQTPPFVKESECKITLMPSEKLSSTTLRYKLADGSEKSLNLTEEKNTTTWTGTVIIYSTTPNGIASFTWKGMDIAGNEGIKITDGKTFTIDTSAPTIGNMKPTNDSFISAEVKDETSGVDERSIIMKIDGRKVDISYSPEQGIVSYKPDIALSEGEHTVMIEASDKAGNKAERSFSFPVDTVAPKISNVTPPDGSLLNDAVSIISAEVKDETSGVDERNIILEVDGKRENISYNPESGTVIYKPGQALSEGEHRVTIEGIDRAGNKAQKDWAFKIDTIQPTARIEVLPRMYPSMTVILTPSENLRGNPTLTLTPYSESTIQISPNEERTVWSGGINMPTDTGSPTRFNFSFSGIDIAGNEGTIITEGRELSIAYLKVKAGLSVAKYVYIDNTLVASIPIDLRIPVTMGKHLIELKNSDTESPIISVERDFTEGEEFTLRP